MEKKKKSKKGIFIALIIIIILVAGGFLAYKMISNGDIKLPTLGEQKEAENNTIVVDLEEQKKEIKIFNGIDRPIAVMIDNHKGAQPQGGLNDAYLVYEIIAEGGESRMMALFKGVKNPANQKPPLPAGDQRVEKVFSTRCEGKGKTGVPFPTILQSAVILLLPQ